MAEPSSISKLKESIEKLKTAINEYSLAVEKKIEELKNAKGLAENTVAVSKEEQEKIKVEIEKTKVEKNALEGQLNTTETELVNAILENGRIGGEIVGLTGQLTMKDAELRTAAENLAAEQERIAALNTTIEEKQREFEQLRDQLDVLLQESIEEQIRNADEIVVKDNEIQKILETNKTLSDEQQNEIDRLNRERDALVNQNATSSAEQQKKDAEITRLQTTYNTKEAELNTSIDELLKANGETTETINKLQNDLAKSTTATAEEKEKNKTLLSEIIKKQNQLTEQSKQIEKANDAVIAMQSQIDGLQSKQHDLTSQHNDCQSKMVELNKQIEEANTKINELQAIVEGNTKGLINNPNGDFDNDKDEEESSAPSNSATSLDTDFGVAPGSISNEGIVFHPLGEPYKENGASLIRLKAADGKETTIPYDETTKLPKGTDGKNGSKISWKRDGDDFIKTEVGFKNGKETGSPITRKYTVKGGRMRKASKTVKKSAKKYGSNKRNTKRKHKQHKKQTYKR